MLSATKTAIPTLGFSAIIDAATTQQDIYKIKNIKIRMYHPWSSLTDESWLGDQVMLCTSMVMSGIIIIE